MGKVINFEDRAVANLRARVAAAEEANQDLIAFARGHSGAVASIHEAVLSAVDAEGLDHLIHIVTQEWPQILGLDGMQIISEIRQIYDNYDFGTQILVASVRHPVHVLQSALIGADVMTAPPAVIRQLFKHPLTDRGLEAFLADWQKTGQTIG